MATGNGIPIKGRKRSLQSSQGTSSCELLPAVLFCEGCERPCRNQAVLTSHRSQCAKLKRTPKDSFWKFETNREAPTVARNEKVALPSSQPAILFPPMQPRKKASAKRGMYGDVLCRSTRQSRKIPRLTKIPLCCLRPIK